MLEYNLLEEVKTESRGSKSAKKQKYPKKAEYLWYMDGFYQKRLIIMMVCVGKNNVQENLRFIQ